MTQDLAQFDIDPLKLFVQMCDVNDFPSNFGKILIFTAKEAC